jgi:hypothetical protein
MTIPRPRPQGLVADGPAPVAPLLPAPGFIQADLDALLATGATLGEALGLASQAHGPEAVLPLLDSALRGANGSRLNHAFATDLLNAVATNDPELAHQGLDAWGRDRMVGVDVDLSRCPWIARIPEGMVADYLDLTGTALRSLPRRLEVGMDLYLLACHQWDGVIPPGLMVGNKVYTPSWPHGATMGEIRDDASESGGGDA